MQDGNTYLAAYHYIPERNWTQKSYTGLEASDFSLAFADGNVNNLHPDFTKNGSEITWGFFRANSSCRNCSGYTVVGGIDDWSVTVHTADPVPEPSSILGAIAGGTFGIRFFRKKRSLLNN
ncbi:MULTISPECIES: PEP-CTERM sorting domain-containing protein [Planktothricoides]|uniref:PEP-CTERM sorting domain-containing protein n=2 Tax=Planktothricoides raciborskii TaxID=132608 RepID=A0AAU8JBC7_9CYAN|nr:MULTISPECIES: PEP-CTERM sorting domain-containing protein [Planktothricoides]KOR37409.1 hypothetical protein AM228_07105 [Planktothricoides sp. SR001]MBD2543172.1 PEP-CTERM sorting domain-containing protein [Planktothricoides raciborskii FACHB-1370]MBD2580913.1 PEP-CTERM sorting domain-containing protein [Planktothricoides raciborskii FACHB-1261]